MWVTTSRKIPLGCLQLKQSLLLDRNEDLTGQDVEVVRRYGNSEPAVKESHTTTSQFYYEPLPEY